jgi:hydroxyacyl-ACP dehydratase HTD2-like protein with hotdog domain
VRLYRTEVAKQKSGRLNNQTIVINRVKRKNPTCVVVTYTVVSQVHFAVSTNRVDSMDSNNQKHSSPFFFLPTVTNPPRIWLRALRPIRHYLIFAAERLLYHPPAIYIFTTMIWTIDILH